MEVVKYMTKSDYVNDTPEHLQELYYSLKGSRQISTWGVLYKIPREVDRALDSLSDEQITDLVCQVCGCTKGTLEKLHHDVWQDEYIVDYSQKTPQDISPERVEKIRRLNDMIDEMTTDYIQEEFEIYAKEWE